MTAFPEDLLVIGLGGNVGGEDAVIERFVAARRAFAAIGQVRNAALYRTTPLGPPQPAFVNSALSVRYRDATPDEALATVLEIERLLGRDRGREVRDGPRAIDLDILVWGTREIASPEITVPHPRLAERRFALQPLADLFGEAAEIPGKRATIGALLRRVSGQTVDEIAANW